MIVRRARLSDWSDSRARKLLERGIASYDGRAPDWDKVRAAFLRGVTGHGLALFAECDGEFVGYLGAELLPLPYHEGGAVVVTAVYEETPGAVLPMLLRAARLARRRGDVLQVMETKVNAAGNLRVANRSTKGGRAWSLHH